jgi:hypothetical protein
MIRVIVLILLSGTLSVRSWAGLETEVPEIKAEGYQLVYEVESSINLESWEAAGPTTILPSTRGPDFEKLRWVLPELSRQFVRLRVTLE